MNINTLLLTISIAVLGTTMAQATPSLNTILSGIDGEYSQLEDDSRVNFEMLSSDSSDRTLDLVLSGVDAEYDRSNTTRVNYSMDSAQSNHRLLDEILSAVDGEY
jgi:hypothetical protein